MLTVRFKVDLHPSDVTVRKIYLRFKVDLNPFVFSFTVSKIYLPFKVDLHVSVVTVRKICLQYVSKLICIQVMSR
jgi:hypothetical protein